MSYVEASDVSLRKTGQIKLHGPSGFAGMRKAGALVAKCLDGLTDLVRPGLPTAETLVNAPRTVNQLYMVPKVIE